MMTLERFDDYLNMGNPMCPKCESFEMHAVSVGDTGGMIGHFCDRCMTFFPEGKYFDIAYPKDLRG